MSRKHAFLLVGLAIPASSSSASRYRANSVAPLSLIDALDEPLSSAAKPKPAAKTSSTAAYSGGVDLALSGGAVTLAQFLRIMYPTSPAMATSLGDELAVVLRSRDSIDEWGVSARKMNEVIAEVNAMSDDDWKPTLGVGVHSLGGSNHATLTGEGELISNDSVMFGVSNDPQWKNVKYTNTCANMVQFDFPKAEEKPKGILRRILASSCTSGDASCVHMHLDPLPDPLRHEYIIMKTIGLRQGSGTPLTPRIIELSVAMIPGRTSWIERDPRLLSHSVATIENIVHCHDRRALVRALAFGDIPSSSRVVMAELYHKDSATWGNDPDTHKMSLNTMKKAIQIGLNTIGTLKKIHDFGFIHGSVTSDDVLLDRGGNVQFMNFAKAKFFPVELGTSELQHPFIRDTSRIDYSELSPWVIEGKRSGRRDDIFSAIEMTASLLLPNGEFDKYVKQIYDYDVEESVSWMPGTIELKKEMQYFEDRHYDEVDHGVVRFKTICGQYQSIDARSNLRCRKAMAHLAEALRIIRGVQHADERPAYEDIIVHYEDALMELRD
jgi:hypothetical protein